MDAPGADTAPVEARHRFDVAALEGNLDGRVEGFRGPVVVERFQGGQSNPTYKLTTPSACYVLRRKPPGKLLASAHAVEREYRVMTALGGSPVPVPRTLCLCEEPAVIGTPFYVMEWVAGRVLWDPALPALEAAERRAIYGDMNRVIAALHGVDYAAIGLGDFGKHGNYFARQIDRWSRQYRASQIGEVESFERLIEWLPANVPAGDETALVHGDYRLDNLILHPTEPRVLAVLDWELSTLGHPLADLAYHCMTWHIPQGVFRGLGGVDLAALGIPSEEAYVEEYRRRAGRGPIDPDLWRYSLAYNLFRLGTILQGIMGRVQDGTAASRQAAEMGQAAPVVADMAWHQVEQILKRR